MQSRLPAARLALGILATLLVATTLVDVPESAAQSTQVTISRSRVSAARDYATTAFADAWDFSNKEDHRLGPNAQMQGLSGAKIAGGVFSATAASGSQGKLVMLDTYAPDAIPWGRDGETHPIDANRYKRASLRIYSSGPSQTAWLQWMRCGKFIASCIGGHAFNLEPGWNTYDFNIANTTNVVQWNGVMKGLVLTPTQQGGATKIDWIRIYEPRANNSVTIDTGGQSSGQIVYWDRDANRQNNTASNPNWGVVGETLYGSVNLDADQLPPGTYRFYRSGTGYSPPLVVDALPAPVVIDPDLAGGTDYATIARGDAWDFSNGADLAGARNTTVAVGGGVVSGVNTGPDPTDSGFYPSLAGPINGSRYHRLSVRAHYEGGFSLSGSPGGGMSARVAWRKAGTATENVSEDIVVYPGWNDIVVDLATSPPAAISDSGAGLGWAGTVLDAFRFDPHEDPGSRRWTVDEIRLAADDFGADQFTIKFADKAHEPGTTAKIYVDDNSGGFNGRLIDTVAVKAGENRYVWRPKNDFGKKWIYVVLTDPAGNSTGAYSTGPVDMVRTSLDGSPSAFTPLTPTRILDTRNGLGAPAVPVGAGGTVNLQVTGRGGVPSGATTAVVNVTATESAADGYVTVWPTGFARPTASNLNLERPGQTIPNLVTAPIGAGGKVSIFSQKGTHLVADVLGYYTPRASSSPGRFVPVTPSRLADTRSGPAVAAKGTLRVPVAGRGGVPAEGASAVVLNVTATETTDAGYLTVWPSGVARPLASNLNVEHPGQTIPNQVIVPIGSDGAVNVFSLTSAHVVVDVAGWFTDGSAEKSSRGLFVPMTPKRLLDTRGSGAVPARGTTTVQVGGRAGVPSNASGATLNVTMTEAFAPGFVTVWPAGVARPLASNLNVARAGQTIPNHVTTPLGSRSASIYVQSGGHVIADISGYYTSAS